MGVKILGMGSYLPEKILTNADLEKMVETSDEWIVERTGIKERHIAAPEEATSDLAYRASLKALEKAGITPEQIDGIIVATASPDYLFPATACILQAKLGAKKAMCFDVEAACPGFVYALEIARGLLSLPNYRYLLIVGAETLSRLVDYTDRNTCVLFGDGAGAAVVTKDDSESDVLASYLKGNGEVYELLMLPAGAARNPASEKTIGGKEHYIKMQGREVFKYAVMGMQEAAEKVLERADIRSEDIDWLVPHQANIRIIDATRERLGIPWEKVYVNIEKTGNTSAASIPIALAEMDEKGLLKRGQRVLLVSFGAGFIYGAILLRW
uniref:Beta-ketoacyl-[acyl-carrier-protein] synthase III n=1 Tax=candidate division WOR-3 bacterium TaxID=2052148 RepID=A0A7V4E5P7_UNCW3